MGLGAGGGRFGRLAFTANAGQAKNVKKEAATVDDAAASGDEGAASVPAAPAA